jgi:hypothetical protein
VTANGSVTKAARRDRFASGAAVRLELSDGDWILVRQELSYGQQRRLATAGLVGVPEVLAQTGQGRQLSVDWAAFDIARLVAWVMDWSFRDADGEPVVVSREAIEALEPATAAELNAALDRHIEGLEAKKAPAATGGARPAATSSSASASAGRGPS